MKHRISEPSDVLLAPVDLDSWFVRFNPCHPRIAEDCARAVIGTNVSWEKLFLFSAMKSNCFRRLARVDLFNSGTKDSNLNNQIAYGAFIWSHYEHIELLPDVTEGDMLAFDLLWKSWTSYRDDLLKRRNSLNVFSGKNILKIKDKKSSLSWWNRLKKWALLSLFSGGCTSIAPNDVSLPSSLLNNRASLSFAFEGKQYIGTATLQRRSSSNITFNLPDGTILFQLDNCAREHVKIRPTGSTYVYVYTPSLYKEAEGSCLMQAQATTFRGEMMTAIIDWTDSSTLKARMWCNENLNQEHTGVAICQNRSQKLMWIEFNEPVVWAKSDDCEEPQTPPLHRRDYAFEIKLKQGLCAYGFMSEKREKFRLTTYGYTTIREVNIEVEKGVK